MENETTTQPTPVAVKPADHTELTDREMLVEIYKNSKKTKSYMMWQLIITVVLVVVPLLATIFLIPYALKSLGSAYGLDSLTGGGTNSSSMQDLIQQYTK